MTIKLENFSATIEIESVDLVLNGKYGTTLQGFTYTTTWEDSEVLEWANKELNKYVIK